jgi:outer membrane receptor protein involved in Fe transport
MANNQTRMRTMLLAATALTGSFSLAMAGPAAAQERSYALDLPAQSLSASLMAFGSSTDQQIVFSEGLVKGRAAPKLKGDYTASQALAMLLDDTGLVAQRNADGVVLITRASDPQSGSAAGDGADNGTVQALIVTAQKREENIQDVPIAMSAFSQEDLTRSQVAGGPDLMTQVPNMTFTKTNFTSYSIQIRGIGTQAISATTDPAVAVAFNNTPFVRNHFFEQEFYDLQRVEVLRGPQGTLYGRNATAGVVNVISQKPKFTYEAKLSADVGNYSSTRVEGMVNVPLVEDKVALRLAGAWTKRQGYDTNQITGNQIDGRDLWSTRATLRFSPTDHIDANLIWEHFEENDDRIRSGKQLCKTDEVTNVAGFTTTHYQVLPEYGQSILFAGVQGSFSQGCAPSSLYSPDSFQTPNGLALPYYTPLTAVFLPTALTDPYVSRTQSHDLRTIESTVDPKYKAKNDTVELQFAIDLGDNLNLSSETAWASDFIFSSQDFNRFNTASGAFRQPDPFLDKREGVIQQGPNGGVFCDPQIGCADRLVAVDLSTAKSRHFSQEFRLASDFDGPFNFSLGANFLRYDTEDKYYVFINTLSIISALSPYGHIGPLSPYVGGVTDNSECLPNGMALPDYNVAYPVLKCTYIDPNPIGNLNDLGHNYFLSKNPYKLISYAVFGEAYYNITDNLKLTAGLRWTVDKKEAPLLPSWVLASDTAGYSVAEVVRQEWREPTGRLTLDWKPDLSFTDETMVYASYAHGYKAGGANPPTYGKALYGGEGDNLGDLLIAQSVTHPKTFDPEFVNAFEIGSKNTLLGGRLTLNGSAFYYDYTGYQISQIVDRSASNLNFDAKVWGLELEADWRPLENLKLGFKGGYEKTRVADGERAIDIMDRTAGNPDWVVYRPFPSVPSNCILPAWLFVGNTFRPGNPELVNVGGRGGGNRGGCELAYSFGYDPATGLAYVADPYNSPPIGPFPPNGDGLRNDVDYPAWSTNRADYPCLPAGVTIGVMDYPGVDPACLAALSNNGEGLFKDLSGNELPNAPHFTATITADYTLPLPNNWLATLHTDLYYQSEAWTRIFNMPGYDKLKAYTNVNLAAIFTNEDAGWKVMAYVKNVLDHDSITGAFLNSDDTGLTTNVFLTEPRLYGLRVTKEFDGGPWWTGANLNHPAGEPYPLTVELGGQVQRHDAPYENLAASWAAGLGPNTPDDVENRDLDWGDGRSLKVTYRPEGSKWEVFAGVRFGRTNIGTSRSHHQSQDAFKSCRFPIASFAGHYFCDPDATLYGYSYYSVKLANVVAPSSSDVQARAREEHMMADFGIGRDVGVGSLTASTLDAAIRYAEFKSHSEWSGSATGDWNLPDGWQFYPATNHQFSTEMSADRDFKGAGPVLSWSAAVKMLGSEDAGHLDIDWSVDGGVLFGNQKTKVVGSDKTFLGSGLVDPFSASDLSPGVILSGLPRVGGPVVVDRSASRSGSATVPLVNLSLGLSYENQRIKVGAGYRWERYFNVLDVGVAAHKDADRTIDGPYFKIAVGFGG